MILQMLSSSLAPKQMIFWSLLLSFPLHEDSLEPNSMKMRFLLFIFPSCYSLAFVVLVSINDIKNDLASGRSDFLNKCFYSNFHFFLDI